MALETLQSINKSVNRSLLLIKPAMDFKPNIIRSTDEVMAEVTILEVLKK